MTIGNIIKSIIKEQHMTQEELGLLSLNKTQGAVYNFLSNKNTGIESILRLLGPVGYGLVICDIETYVPKYLVTMSTDKEREHDPSLPWVSPKKPKVRQKDLVGHKGRVSPEEKALIMDYINKERMKQLALKESQLKSYEKFYKQISKEIQTMKKEIDEIKAHPHLENYHFTDN